MGSLEALGRAVEEIEALEAIFGYDEGGFTVHSDAALASAQAAADGSVAGGGLGAAAAGHRAAAEARGGGRGRGRGGGGRTDGEAPDSLPPGYPESCGASVSVSVEGLPRAAADTITAALTTKAATLLGDEAVMELVQELQDVAPGVLAAERAAIAAAVPPACEPAGAADDGSFGRRWMW